MPKAMSTTACANLSVESIKGKPDVVLAHHQGGFRTSPL